MTDLRKAAEKALKALENMSPDTDTLVEVKPHVWEYRGSLAIQALRQALDLQTAIEKGTKAWADVPDVTEWVEELRGNDTPEVTPEVNEPEGWVKIDEVRQYLDSFGCATIYKTAGEDRVPLYSAPQREWVGLTANEVYECWKSGDVVAAVEAKLKDKNT